MNTKENRQFKNSIFVDLFCEDESAEQNNIALYNALHSEPLPDGTKIQKLRIDNVLYMNFKMIFLSESVEKFLYSENISPPLTKICRFEVFFKTRLFESWHRIRVSFS